MNRSYAALLREYLTLFPCVALIGPRQCGKTTLLETLPEGWQIFDLERAADAQLVERDPDLFFRLNPERVAIDEAQQTPTLFPALRVAIDAQRNTTGRFVITGSSSPDLLKALSESLAGRVALIEMAPLSFLEATQTADSPFFDLLTARADARTFIDTLQPRHSLETIHTYWLNGGYPEQWIKADSRFHSVWMEQYIQTYLYRDVARLFPGLNRNRFHTFIHFLGGLSGTSLNYSDVARTLGVSAPTIHDYIDIAHGTFFWRKIPPYERNTLKRVVKRPRGYLRDSGLLHHLQRIPDRDALLRHPQMGFSWEGMVIEELIRGLNTRGIGHASFFYRTAAGAEVDLILDGAFGLIPFEIKYNQTVSLRSLRPIREFMAEHGSRIGFVISNDDRVRLFDEKLVGVPFAAL
ncbi:MAG: ATP-binding protein [candidate division Zixibacteria bacterium]|nr:ATP-binding protein [candidate division Zixibacteria bacterium]